jgi:hypothetical protein
MRKKRLPKPTHLCNGTAITTNSPCKLLARWPDGKCDKHTKYNPPADVNERAALRRKAYQELNLLEVNYGNAKEDNK